MSLSRPLTAWMVLVGLVGSLLVLRAAEPAVAASAAGRGIAASAYLGSTAEKSLPDKLRAAGARWSYNWTYRVPPSTPGLETVPMLRSATSISDASISTLTAGRVAGNYRYLLGFNEPDGVNQANLTPGQAANLWPKLQKTGLILGSPAPAVPTNGWLKEFMAIAAKRSLKVDFIALHFYAQITDDGALARIKSQVELIRRNYGKPIWITELGIIDRRTDQGSTATNWARSVKFMRSVTAMLDAKTYVQRYAWMSDKVTTRPLLKWSTLYDVNGQFTPLGNAYRSLG